MEYQTNIKSLEGKYYHLHIRTLNRGHVGQDPKNICIFINISHQFKKDKFQAGSLDLRYNLKTGNYKALEELKNLNALLYDDIINELATTYGINWGVI